jgi:hypothetical protein
MKTFWMTALLILLMTACGGQNNGLTEVNEPQDMDPEVIAEQADEPRDLAELARSNPEALREALRDPERRQAAMEAMREHRGEGEMDPEQRERREEMRERMRQRREELMAEREGLEPGERVRERRAGARGNWWEDEDIAERLELSETQAESLGQVSQSLDQTRRESRQTMTQSQRQMHQALQAVDRDRVEQLLEERQAASRALDEAERLWLRTLLAELNDEQIKTLAEEYPQVLAARRR